MAELNQETINAKLIGMLSGQDRGTTADITNFALAYWDGAAVRYLFLHEDGHGALDEHFDPLPISKLTNGTISWSHGIGLLSGSAIRASRKSVPNLSNALWVVMLRGDLSIPTRSGCRRSKAAPPSLWPVCRGSRLASNVSYRVNAIVRIEMKRARPPR
jgi:hypothetical protein